MGYIDYIDCIDLQYISNTLKEIENDFKDKSVNDDFSDIHKRLDTLRTNVRNSTCAYQFISSSVLDLLEILDNMITSYHDERKCTMPELCSFCDHIRNIISMSLLIL